MAAQTGDHMLRMVEGLASLREEVKDLRTQNKALQTRLCKGGEPQDFFWSGEISIHETNN